jgi:predicted ribosome quality control (RQC) complex YloA/Tae2 family protein
MPFDALVMAAVADELSNRLPGGQVQRIIQPSMYAVALSVYGGGSQHWLVLSADPQSARVHLSSDRLAKAFATPSGFVMVLRRYLEGSRVRSVVQVVDERIIRVECGRADERFALLSEVMGKHSNVMLLDTNDRILGAMKVVTSRQSRVRPILPGHAYQPPPPRPRDVALFGDGDRIDPRADSDQFVAMLSSAPAGTSLRTALLGLLPGAGPFLCEQIALSAGLAPTDRVGDVDLYAVTSATVDKLTLGDRHAWQPCTFTSPRGRADFTAFVPLSVADVQPRETISEAVEEALAAGESRDPLSNVRKSVLDGVVRAHRSASSRLRSLREGLESARDANEVMQRGQMVLAYAHSIPRGSDRLELPELDMSIALDPRLSAPENAERLFRRYRKLRDAAARLPAMIDVASSECERLDELSKFVAIAASESDLRSIESEARGREPAQDDARSKRPRRKGPPRYRYDSWTASAGRTAAENEEVTFRIASRDDLWLHARERTGAHVVVQGGTRGLPDDVLLAAASLAAFLSEGKEDTAVDVDVAAVRDVRKIPNGPPGRVTYRNFETVRAAPSMEGWTRLG